jgi:hypothetical protein
MFQTLQLGDGRFDGVTFLPQFSKYGSQIHANPPGEIIMPD